MKQFSSVGIGRVSPAPQTARIEPADPAVFSANGFDMLPGWEKLNFNRVMANNFDVFRPFISLLARSVAGSHLPADDRQILVTRTCLMTGEVYEFTHHILISENAGISESVLAAVKNEDPAVLDERKLLLCKAVDEIVQDFCVSDDTWKKLACIYTPEELIEMTTLVGVYMMMAVYTRSFGVQLEDPETFQGFQEVRPYT